MTSEKKTLLHIQFPLPKKEDDNEINARGKAREAKDNKNVKQIKI
jgi:hypothetical protein